MVMVAPPLLQRQYSVSMRMIQSARNIVTAKIPSGGVATRYTRSRFLNTTTTTRASAVPKRKQQIETNILESVCSCVIVEGSFVFK